MSLPLEEIVASMQDKLIMEELNFYVEALSNELARYLENITNEQHRAYDLILNVVNNGQGYFFFLYGCDGIGKTFVWRTFSVAIRSKGGIVLNVASSKIASLLLPN